MPRSKTSVFWVGLSLLVLGVVFASFGIWSSIRERTANRELESMVRDLRNNGAIVENYYKVIGGDERVEQPRHGVRFCLVAGILVAGGIAMIAFAHKNARQERGS